MDEQLRALLGEDADAQTAAGISAYISENYVPKTSVAALSRENEQLKTGMEAMRRTERLREGLRQLGVTEPDYVIYKRNGLDGFTFDADGKPTGLEEIVKTFAGSPVSTVLFREKQAYAPNSGQNAADNPFAADSFNLTEQGRLYKASPEAARRLAAAAGIKLKEKRR